MDILKAIGKYGFQKEIFKMAKKVSGKQLPDWL